MEFYMGILIIRFFALVTFPPVAGLSGGCLGRWREHYSTARKTTNIAKAIAFLESYDSIQCYDNLTRIKIVLPKYFIKNKRRLFLLQIFQHQKKYK
jgi:hypothetical protein